MSRRHLLSVSITLVVVAALCIGESNAGLLEKNHVAIKNELPLNRLLIVHCKSKDDDLGFQLLAAGANYEFGFHDNTLLSTLFWCNLWQGPGYRLHQAFVVYRSLGFPQFGKRYAWEAREDGIYQYIDENHSIFKYRWGPPRQAASPLSSVDDNSSLH